jgi:hypothetical protein
MMRNIAVYAFSKEKKKEKKTNKQRKIAVYAQ